MHLGTNQVGHLSEVLGICAPSGADALPLALTVEAASVSVKHHSSPVVRAGVAQHSCGPSPIQTGCAAPRRTAGRGTGAHLSVDVHLPPHCPQVGHQLLRIAMHPNPSTVHKDLGRLQGRHAGRLNVTRCAACMGRHAPRHRPRITNRPWRQAGATSVSDRHTAGRCAAHG